VKIFGRTFRPKRSKSISRIEVDFTHI